MSFRSRLVLATGAAVSIAIVLASVSVYVLVRSELRSQIDSQLEEFAGGVFAVRLQSRPARAGKTKVTLKQLPMGIKAKKVELALPSDPLGGRLGFAQVVNSKGKVLGPPQSGTQLPVTPQTLAVARGEAGPYFSDAEINGVHARIFTHSVGNGRVVQAARSLTEVDDTLSRLTLILVAVCAAGLGLAIGFGLLVGRTALRPVARLTAAAEHVARTRDLSRRIQTGSRRDELASLARSFNTMLAALERSLAAQRQLVADASHELRTPLTSLRTNVEVLADGERLEPAERERLLADVVAQLEELTALVGDLVDLAREEQQPPAPEDVRFDALVEGAVARARRHWPELSFEAELEPALVHGDPSRLDRAVANLLANAAQWSPAGGAVEVELSGTELRVRDHGPGFDPAEVEHVFDRFYRAPAARGRPGSGLGLAIVRQVAETHGGGVAATNAPGGGALVSLRLPLLAGAAAPTPAELALSTS